MSTQTPVGDSTDPGLIRSYRLYVLSFPTKTPESRGFRITQNKCTVDPTEGSGVHLHHTFRKTPDPNLDDVSKYSVRQPVSFRISVRSKFSILCLGDRTTLLNIHCNVSPYLCPPFYLCRYKNFVRWSCNITLLRFTSTFQYVDPYCSDIRTRKQR